jgi:hypothetical protein
MKEHVIRLPSSGKPVTLSDALRLHRHLNDGEAFRWARRNPGLFRLIHVTDALVA